MNILYAIQGTGNGHLSRAEDVIPALRQHGEVDLFVSGAQADIKLSYPVKYKSKGLSFYFGKNGGIDFLRTFKRNSSKEVLKEIKKFPVENYDVVINDFEPISAWACHKKDIPCVGLSHQSAMLSPKTPRPKNYDPVGDWLLKNYAPANAHVGFHFDRFDNWIYTPVIRSEIRDLKIENKEHYTVYLPSYHDRKLLPLLAKIPHIRWHIFSKHTHKSYHIGKLSVYPVNKEEFAASMTSAKGILCGAGFETPAEALYLRKKLLVIPMKSQYEQHCNAAALKRIGVPVVKKMKEKYLDKIIEWIESNTIIDVNYPDITAQAVDEAMRIAQAL